MAEVPDLFQTEAAGCGLNLDPDVCRLLSDYADLVKNASRSLSLTSLGDPLELIRELIFDPLVAVADDIATGYLEASANLVDIGAGTGSPGVPLAAANRGLELYPLESVSKKARFLSGSLTDLGLRGNVLEGRAEELGRDPEFRESFDLASTKAVGSPETCLELALSLLRTGGIYLGLFGSDTEIDSDARVLQELGGELVGVREYRLPWKYKSRRLAMVRKSSQTPQRYPRRAGVPRRRPLT